MGLGVEFGLTVGVMVLSDWQLWASADVQVGLLLLSWEEVVMCPDKGHTLPAELDWKLLTSVYSVL